MKNKAASVLVCVLVGGCGSVTATSPLVGSDAGAGDVALERAAAGSSGGAGAAADAAGGSSGAAGAAAAGSSGAAGMMDAGSDRVEIPDGCAPGVLYVGPNGLQPCPGSGPPRPTVASCPGGTEFWGMRCPQKYFDGSICVLGCLVGGSGVTYEPPTGSCYTPTSPGGICLLEHATCADCPR